MKEITSRDNQYIKEAVKLKQRKYREAAGLFLMEGERAVNEACRQPELLVRVFVDQQRVQMYPGIIDGCPEDSCYIVDSKVMTTVCSTENPQGIAAVVSKPQWNREVILNKGSLLVLLDEITDPGNLGTIIRSGWAMGVDGFLLGNGCADVFSPKVVRSTMGGILDVPVFQGIAAEFVKNLKTRGYKVVGADGRGPIAHYEYSFLGASIIAIGNEARGLSPDIASQCDSFIKIPIKSGVDSLNAAVACGIIINEAWRQRSGCSLC